MIESVLGAGGMGVVYRAHDLALGRPVAIKIIPETFSPALRERLLRETEACARLQHPAVATYFESGEAGPKSATSSNRAAARGWNVSATHTIQE